MISVPSSRLCLIITRSMYLRYLVMVTRELTTSSNWPIKSPETGVVSQTQAVALGLGSLFNHSLLQQNVGWSRDLTGQCIVYKALRDIRAGEELCINYGKLWFVDADEEQRQQQDNDNDNFLSNLEIFD